MRSFHRLVHLLVVIASLAAFAGCAGAPKQTRYTFPTSSPASPAVEQWLGGEEAGAIAALDSIEQRRAEELFVAAEAHFWRGDVERAFDLYAALLSDQPEHPLSRFAAARLHDMHDDVIDFHDRVAPVIAKIRYRQVNPLTASYLSMIGQRVAWRRWYLERAERPFSADAQGLPLRWMTTPRLSTWRLLDFDRALAPEEQPHLADEYLSPYHAEEHPSNRERATPFISSNINLSPKLGGSGVYYLETFATVDADEDQVFWLYANFSGAARVWIDGEQVLERREGRYETGKRWRRVKLSPGTHRVLLKLAYQPNYRDWFDLNFLNADATAFEGSAVSFTERPPEGARAGELELLSTQRLPAELEPMLVTGEEVAQAPDIALYLTAVAAHYDRQAEVFEPAIEELLERRPDFAAAHGLKSLQVQTLWEVPSKLRDATALQSLRTAAELDPDSIHYMMRLGNWLRRRGKDPEVRELLERARDQAVAEDGRLRNIMPLNSWANYLESQGWDQASEQAWKRALEVAPSNCGAASNLQAAYHARNYYPTPDQITPAHERCPGLYDTWVKAQPELFDERLAMQRRRAMQYPYDTGAQVSYAEALIAEGRLEEARGVLDAALARRPESFNLYATLADLALAEQGPQAAREVIEGAVAKYGNNSWAVWRLSALSGEIPLQDLILDGVEVAKKLAASDPVAPPSPTQPEAEGAEAKPEEPQPAQPVQKPAGGGDEAFYAIDFAARRYFDDGSSVTLTHTMVRVMTKNAIDRFAEVQVPGNARVLIARTVKQDGATVVPEQTAGKETLSMPGLAPGDFVELAYLEYDSPSSLSNTRRLGTRFFFKMRDISSMHSEFVIIHPTGDFIRRNDAPEAQPFDYHGVPAVRFLRQDSPRPRSEPYAVGGEEYLPWIQQIREGNAVETFELSRRAWRDEIIDALKTSRQLEAQFNTWLAEAGELRGDALVRDLFYRVTAYFTSPSSSLRDDISHGLLTREGNPMLVLKRLYDGVGVDAQIYLARSSYADPVEHPMNEMSAYSASFLRVVMPDSGRAVWLAPSGPDSMFGAIASPYLGQPAVCITCEKPNPQTLPSRDLVRDDGREMTIESSLAADGTLSGTVRQTYDGPSAEFARGVLRQRTEETQRAKFIEALLAEHIPGATISGYRILDAEDRHSPITFEIDFSRKNFARRDGNTLTLEAALFRQPLASLYTTLPDRTIPIMVGRARDYHDRLVIALPEGMKPSLRSKNGEWKIEGPFGTYARSVTLEDGALVIDATVDVPIQRVQPDDYAAFQQWAIGVERSSIVLMDLAP